MSPPTHDTVRVDILIADIIIPDTVTSNTVTADTLIADAVTPNTVTADTLIADAITPDTVTADTLIADAVTLDTLTDDTESYLTWSLAIIGQGKDWLPQCQNNVTDWDIGQLNFPVGQRYNHHECRL